MKKNKKTWIAVVCIAILAIVIFLLSGGKKKEEVTFETAKIEKGNIQTTITATGTIEPVTSVTVGTQVSGIVSRLYVDYNSIVKKGQVIAELDKTNLTSELNTAKANLASAQSTLNYEQANYNRTRPYTTKDSSVLMTTRALNSAIARLGRVWPPPERVWLRPRPTSAMPPSPVLLMV